MLLGYVWLGLAGVLWLLGPERVSGGFWYDAMLHTVSVGFAFSMIFGHAPTKDINRLREEGLRAMDALGLLTEPPTT